MQKEKKIKDLDGKEKKHSKGKEGSENVIFCRVLEHSFQKSEGRKIIYKKGKLIVGKGWGTEENEGGLDIIVNQENLNLFNKNLKKSLLKLNWVKLGWGKNRGDYSHWTWFQVTLRYWGMPDSLKVP